MSRAERRTRAQAESEAKAAADVVASGLPPDEWRTMRLDAFGIALVPGSATKWWAFKCSTDGTRETLTPLRDGKLLGEGKPNATARWKVAVVRSLGGLE